MARAPPDLGALSAILEDGVVYATVEAAAKVLCHALTASVRMAPDLKHWHSLPVSAFFARFDDAGTLLVETLRELQACNPNTQMQMRYVEVLIESWRVYRRDVLKSPTCASGDISVSSHTASAPASASSMRLSAYACVRAMQIGPQFPPRLWCRIVALLALPLAEADRLALVRSLLAQRQWKTATACATSLGVAHHFSLEEMCLELVRLGGDNWQAAWSAVKGRPALHGAPFSYSLHSFLQLSLLRRIVSVMLSSTGQMHSAAYWRPRARKRPRPR